MDLSLLYRVLDLDPVTGVALVQARISLHCLSVALHYRGPALQNLGDIYLQTLA